MLADETLDPCMDPWMDPWMNPWMDLGESNSSVRNPSVTQPLSRKNLMNIF